MLKYILRRIAVLVPTFIGVTIVAFSLIRLVPGDPVMLRLGDRNVDPATYAKLKESWGLDKPIPVQYAIYVAGIFKGDLGESVVTRRPITEEFFNRFPATLELGLVALFFAIVLGIPIGMIAAVKRNSFLDYSFIGSSLVGYSMPIFWWGLILILIFSVKLGLTPVAGRMGLEYDIPAWSGFMLIDTWRSPEGAAAFWDALKHLILPAIAMGTIPLAIISRMTRSSLLEVINEDYIRTAKAKGLSFSYIIWVHALRNALIPIVTVIGLMFGTIVTGAILTESIFSWPGIGKWLVNSVSARDYPVVQGGLFLIAMIIVAINMVMDVVYAIVNPRIREIR